MTFALGIDIIGLTFNQKLDQVSFFMTVKLKDIAEAAGVTITTVSYVLNGKNSHTSEETCKKIKAVAEKLGYYTDDIARTMVTGKSNVFGFIAPNPSWEFVAGIMAGSMKRASEINFFIKLINYHYGITADEIIKICRKQRLAGLICYSMGYEIIAELQKKLPPAGIAIIVVSNAEIPKDCIQIMADDEQGGYKAVEHLYKLGHRKIAHITGLNNMPYSIARKNGYLKAMNDFGLAVRDNYIFDPSAGKIESHYVDSTLEYVNKLIKGGDMPSAIFCVSDLYALAAMTELHKNGIKVPADVSIVGYADMYFGSFATPTLSTIKEPYELIGIKAIDLLHQKIEGRIPESNKIVLDVEFIQRESSAPFKKEIIKRNK